MENNNLIIRAKQNDQEAINQIISENQNLIHKIVRKYELELGDYKISKEDLFQEGLIALFIAIRDFKEDKNAKFSTFAFKVINRRIYKVYKKEAQVYIEEGLSYSRVDDCDRYYSIKTDCVSDNPAVCFEQNYYKDVLNMLIERVDDIDKVILKMRANSYSYDEIGKALDISNKTVDYHIRRLKKKFKDEKKFFLD